MAGGTTLYLDTEFTEMNGDLISLALVPETGRSWYGVVEHGEPSDWVKEHVMPFLGQAPVSRPAFIGSLHHYLQGLPCPITVIADWPDDFKYLCDCLVVGPGQAFVPLQFQMKFVDVQTSPKVPHNALSDAEALRDACNG